MPELRRRFLAEHAPDRAGRCAECRNGSGPASERPCLPYRIALEAQRIAEGGSPEPARPPLQTVGARPRGAQVPRPIETAGRRLKAVPAASWQPRW